MATKFQIFISSTFEDLRDERDAVIKAVLEMGHIPVGMEMFSAADEQQWKIIQRHIDESDYYVVLVAHRYGSVTDGVSYTRKEYEYAVDQKVPVLGFIIDPEAAWPADRMDSDADLRLQLEEFKTIVGSRPVGFWKSLDDLHSKSVIALMKAFTASPREGWVRGSATAGPGITAELSRLSAENAALRAELAAAQDAAAADQSKVMRELRSSLVNAKTRISYRYRGESGFRKADEATSLDFVFNAIGASLIPEYPVRELMRLLAVELVPALEDKKPDIVPINTMKALLADLMSFELVGPSSARHSLSDDAEYWALTPHGVEYLKWLNRRRLSFMAARERMAVESAPEPEAPSTDGVDSADEVAGPAA